MILKMSVKTLKWKYASYLFVSQILNLDYCFSFANPACFIQACD